MRQKKNEHGFGFYMGLQPGGVDREGAKRARRQEIAV
jgi:hypothetical protein